MRNVIFTSALLALAAGCKTGTMTKNEVLDYVHDPGNGVYIEYTESGLKWEVMYLPSEIFALNEINRPSFSGEMAQVRAKHDRFCYFSVSVSKEGQEILRRYEQHLPGQTIFRNLAYRLSEHVYMGLPDGQIIHPVNSFSPNTYGLADKTRIIVSFERKEFTDAEWVRLTIADPGFGTGKQFFKFTMNAMNDVPDMKLPQS